MTIEIEVIQKTTKTMDIPGVREGIRPGLCLLDTTRRSCSGMDCDTCLGRAGNWRLFMDMHKK